MPVSNFKKTSARWNCLSKVDLLGSLDFWTLTVSLDALLPVDTDGLSVDDLLLSSDVLYDMDEYIRRKKTLPLAAHEFTHFVDVTSTVWGMHHLQKINDCLSVPMSNERDFFRLKKTYDHMRNIRLPEYYTVVEKGSSATKPWSSAVTTGVLFNTDGSISDRPILFVRFWNANREAIVRSPISVVSLLEASAMAKEIEVRLNLVRHLPADEKIVEQKLLAEELLAYIFNPNITEYSTCFHLLANIQNQTDLGVAARAVGWLARLVLNIPSAAFSTASKNIKAYADRMGLKIDSLEVVRLRMALEQHNHGAMFFLLSVLLPKGALISQVSFWREMEVVLKSIGLSQEKLRRAANEEVLNCMSQLERSQSEPLKTIANAGLHNFRILYPSNLSYPLEKLSLPPALHGNFTSYQFSGGEYNLLKTYDLDVGYDELLYGQLKAENFAEACI